MKKIRLFLAALSISLSSFVLFGAGHAFAATKTWTGGGGDANMTTGGNWGGVAPTAGDDLVFPANITNRTVTNDFAAATSFNSITFNGAATQDSNYTFSGASMTLVAGITDTQTGSFNLSHDIGIALILNGTQTFNAGNNYITVSGNINLGTSALTVNSGTGSVTFSGVVSGTSGTITKTGTGSLVLTGTNTFDGAVTVSAGEVVGNNSAALGSATGGTTVSSGASLYLYKSTGDLTYTEPLTLNGNGMDAYTGALAVGTAFGMGGGGSGGSAFPTTTFSGAITLGSDIKLSAGARNLTITGAITGSHAIGIIESSTGTITLNSSSNGSSTANGILEPAAKETTYSGDQSSTSIQVNNNETAIVTGTYGSVNVNPKGTLKGTGTVGSTFVEGTLAPGMSPGCLNSGDLTLTSTATFQVELGGTTACTQYDQMKVTGSVTLDGTLSVSLYNNFKPTAGQKYVIISNDASDAVSGTFTGLAQGATFTANGYTYSISYTGGDGNDVELTVTAVPPNTGFALIRNNPMVSLAVTLGAAGAIAFMARRQLKPAVARRKR